jgi:hypothetical protein
VPINQNFNSFANAITPKLISISYNSVGAIHGRCNFAGFNDCEFQVIGFTNQCGNTVSSLSIGINTRTPEQTLQDIMTSLKNKYGYTFQMRYGGSMESHGAIGHNNVYLSSDGKWVSNKKGNVTITCSIYKGKVWLTYYVDCRQSFNSSDL